MKNTIRCCIACILPCGALDVIRIVHSNGRVEEISGTIKAGDVMRAHPKHVLKKPSPPSGEKMVPEIVIVPPDAELRRGKIYFLMPAPPAPPVKNGSAAQSKKKRRESDGNGGGGNNGRHHHHRRDSRSSKSNSISMTTNLLDSDQYLSEILSENSSTQRDRRRGRVGVWRPHLESISETPYDA